MRRCALVLVLFTLAPFGAGAVPAGTPRDADDPGFTQGLQWGLEVIGAPSAWPRADGTGITIAVVDSGIDLAHEDLASKIGESISCIGADGDPHRCGGSAQDDDGHGTHVAGIAAAITDNGMGVAAVAPGASVFAVRVLRHQCRLSVCTAEGDAADVDAGIRWAVDHGADVVNLSLGSTTRSVFGSGFTAAIDYAWERGVIPVVAAGNQFVLSSGFSDEPAVVVTATDRSDREASYASGVGSARWGVAAPGGEGAEETSDTCTTGGQPFGVLSTYWIAGAANQYACLAGTSMAAPHVSGALAVLRSAGLSPRAAVELLLSTVDDLGTPGRDATYGHGRINLGRAAASLRGAATTTSTTPRPAPPTPTSSVVVGSSATTATSGDIAAPPAPTVPGRGSGVALPGGLGDEPDDGDGDPPAALVLLAVVLALGAGTATGWVLLRGTLG